MKNYKMNCIELQVTLSLCVIFLLRMLGMFMIIPVLSSYSSLLPDGSTFLIGLAMGVYGIAQIIFQIPFGILSDKFGRKNIIILGLCFFFIGSIFSASIHSIWGVIIGRFLQGSGAISGVSMALLSDIIREHNRSKAIAAVGISFAVSFLLAMVIGPLISQYFGFIFIFWVTVVLSLLCIIIVFFFIPSSNNVFLLHQNKGLDKKIFSTLFNKRLLRYYIGVLFLHFLLITNFMIIPHQLELSGFLLNQHWKLYFLTIVVSFLILFSILFYLNFDFIREYIIEIGIISLMFSEIIFLYAEHHLMFLACALQVFFIGFNLLEVFLPSSLSKKVCVSNKGSVMSIYSTSQFLGIFLGGVLSGVLLKFFTIYQVFYHNIVIIFLWLIISIFCKNKS